LSVLHIKLIGEGECPKNKNPILEKICLKRKRKKMF
jgi:hypothetical protein